MVDIIGDDKSWALRRIQSIVVGDNQPMIIEESEPVPPHTEDLSRVSEKEGGSSVIEPVVIAKGSQTRAWNHFFFFGHFFNEKLDNQKYRCF